MRVVNAANGLLVKAYAGVTGVLLAFNLERDEDRQGLLGFAIERSKDGGPFKWLQGMLDFPGRVHAEGELIDTDKAPIQKFRWSDYAVRPGTKYAYRVHPMYGSPAQPDVRNGVEVEVQTAPWDLGRMQGDSAHHVLFNRAAGASQAFAREFTAEDEGITEALSTSKAKKGKKKLPELSQEALAWLSRGVKEGIVDFIGLAKDEKSALDVAIYQYELPEIVDAVNAAHKRGVKVRLLYHEKQGDKQTGRNVKSAARLPESCKKGRKTSAIFHHKFIVMSKYDGTTRTPMIVLAGSTNFTFNGVYCQANDIHVTGDPAIVQKYSNQFERIFAGEDPSQTKKRDTEQNILDPSAQLQVGFSPRSGEKDLSCFVTLINAAKQDVLFSTAFNMAEPIYSALLGEPHDSILRYGIQDKASKVTGLHADRTADFEAAARLPKGLDGWLEEKNVKGQTGNILIHTKIILVDFTSENPLIISGSHNFSPNASRANDENYMIIRNDTELADTFGCEVLRIYDHYRYRFVCSQQAKKQKGKKKLSPPHLTEDSSWTDDYYDPRKLKYADRLVFSGSVRNAEAAADVHTQPSELPSIQRARATVV